MTRMVWLGLFWALLAIFPARAGQPLDAENLIRLQVGEHFNFVPERVRRVAVGDPAIADVMVLNKKEVLVLGKKPGVTSLLVWDRTFGGAAKRYRIEVDLALPVDAAKQHIRAEGSQVILGGEFPNVETHQAALKTAQGAGGDKTQVLDQSVIPVSGQVQVDIKIVELSKKVLKEAGINLLSARDNLTIGMFAPGSVRKLDLVANAITGEYAVPLAEAFHLVAGSGKSGSLGVLALLERNGLARTLARPSMVVLSGQTASFMAGGEFPIPVAQGLGQVTVTYKPYGIRLVLTPTVFSKERIAVKLAPEVSELDFSNSVSTSGVSVPGILTRRAETTIELGDGESFVIGGLVSQNMVDNVDKVPLLGDIPILGAFFRNSRFAREDRELVIIATPTLVKPIAAKAQLPPLPGAEYDNYEASWMQLLMYGHSPSDAASVGLSQ